MHVLIVEDEPKMAKALKRGLEFEGYAADTVEDGETALNRINMYHNDYDVVLLDLMLPKQDGFKVLEQVRERGIATPILVVTARDFVDDKVNALDVGADDYLVKPFSFKELTARIRALMRRPDESLPTTLLYENLLLDPSAQRIYRLVKKDDGTVAQEELDLTLKEFRLLEYLMRHPNRVLPREEIISHIWDFHNDSFSNFLDVHMKNLRRKLGETGDMIETVRGVGYRLADAGKNGDEIREKAAAYANGRVRGEAKKA
jgi:DNA-binding response OmpR family regulator